MMVSSPRSYTERIQKFHASSILKIRTNLFSNGRDFSPEKSPIFIRSAAVPENLTSFVADFRLRELGADLSSTPKPLSPDPWNDLLELSRDLSYFSSFNSDISGELQRLASLCDGGTSHPNRDERGVNGPGIGYHPSAATQILETASLETVELVVRSCVETLGTSSTEAEAKRAAVGKLRLLAKYRSDFRQMIGASGAIQTLIPLLRSTDPTAQENAVTALFNLSLEDFNKTPITDSGAIKPLVYALRTGTATTKQNAACALLNLSMTEENQITIGVCGAIPPLVSLLMIGSNRGKKDALTTLYKLCSAQQNKERAVSAGVVTPLVALVSEGGDGTAEKAMVVLSCLSTTEEGRNAIVEEGGIPALVEAVEFWPARGKEFAVLTLLQLCAYSDRNRGLLVREGAIPPLVVLTQSSSGRAKQNAETLLKYLREPAHRGSRQRQVNESRIARGWH